MVGVRFKRIAYVCFIMIDVTDLLALFCAGRAGRFRCRHLGRVGEFFYFVMLLMGNC